MRYARIVFAGRNVILGTKGTVDAREFLEREPGGRPISILGSRTWSAAARLTPLSTPPAIGKLRWDHGEDDPDELDFPQGNQKNRF